MSLNAAKRRRAGKRLRGFMLLEQLMAAGVLAATIATTYGVINQARSNIVRASKRQIAISVAKAQAEQLASAPHVLEALTSFTVPGELTITGTYEVVASGVWSDSTPALTSADMLHEIRVTVTYPNMNGVPTALNYRQYRRRR